MVIAECDNMGRDIADNAQEILPWVAQPDIIDLGQTRYGGAAIVFAVVGQMPLDSLHIGIARNNDIEFIAQGRGLGDKRQMARVEIVKSPTAHDPLLAHCSASRLFIGPAIDPVFDIAVGGEDATEALGIIARAKIANAHPGPLVTRGDIRRISLCF